MADTPSAAPGQPPATSQTPEAPATPPVVVKKYANRRLYNTETSSYITLDNLAEMIRAGRDFVVYDAKSGDDITRGVLTQIIVEEESKGSAMLPTAFLRQLIGFYGGNLQGVVPRYLEYTMTSFARQQQQVRQIMERTLSPFLPAGLEEMNRQNMAMFERALSLWNPFVRASGPEEQPEAGSPEPEPKSALTSEQNSEIERLRQEIESLQHQLAAAHASTVVPPAETAVAPPGVPQSVLSDPERSSSNSPFKPQRRAPRGKPGVGTSVG
jgi:polyhydroxyalkanoate synthesis repressor PhaR